MSLLILRWCQVVFNGKILQKYPVDSGELQGSILDPKLFLLYNSDLSDDVICNIAILADDTTFYSMHDQASDLSHQLELTAALKLMYETLLAGSGSGLLILILKKLNLLNLTSLLTWVLFM